MGDQKEQTLSSVFFVGFPFFPVGTNFTPLGEGIDFVSFAATALKNETKSMAFEHTLTSLVLPLQQRVLSALLKQRQPLLKENQISIRRVAASIKIAEGSARK